MISHDIDTLDFSGQRGCHSLICKIGHIPKKDKGDIKGLLQLRNISRAIHAYTTYRESRWTHVQANGIKKSWVQYDSKFGCQRKKDHWHMDVSENGCIPKSSILLGISKKKPSIVGYPKILETPILRPSFEAVSLTRKSSEWYIWDRSASGLFLFSWMWQSVQHDWCW